MAKVGHFYMAIDTPARWSTAGRAQARWADSSTPRWCRARRARAGECSRRTQGSPRSRSRWRAALHCASTERRLAGHVGLAADQASVHPCEYSRIRWLCAYHRPC